MKRKVRKAVIPAAGLGTRFLPATKAIPKEMIPIVDVPMIQHIVEEAVRAGIEDIVLVPATKKRSKTTSISIMSLRTLSKRRTRTIWRRFPVRSGKCAT